MAGTHAAKCGLRSALRFFKARTTVFGVVQAGALTSAGKGLAAAGKGLLLLTDFGAIKNLVKAHMVGDRVH